MNYIKRHWKGDLSLGVSFWVNVVVLSLLIVGIDKLLFLKLSSGHPITVNKVTLLYSSITILIIYPWQIIGAWQSATRKLEGASNALFPRLAQILIFLGVVSTISNVKDSMPTYEDQWAIISNYPSSDFQVSWKEDSSLIHVEGELGFGLTESVIGLIEGHPSINGIVLDSTGGYLYEGRVLAALIEEYNLNTYVTRQCSSACTVAYIAGSKRFLTQHASLGFHQYSNSIRGAELDESLRDEQRMDRDYFESRGVGLSFLDQMYKATADKLWFPSLELLIEAGIVHEILN